MTKGRPDGHLRPSGLLAGPAFIDVQILETHMSKLAVDSRKDHPLCRIA